MRKGAQLRAAPPWRQAAIRMGGVEGPRSFQVGRGAVRPETVARKMANAIKALGVGRFDLIYTTGSQPAGARLRSVELYGTKVLPMVRDLLAG